MLVILNEWLSSLNIFSSNNFSSFLLITFRNFYNGLIKFLRFFGWLFIVDIFLSIVFGDLLLKVSAVVLDSVKSANIPALLMQLVFSIIWFMVTTSFLLSIISHHERVNYRYYMVGFFRYVQLALIFSFIFLLLLNIIVSLGVTTFPGVPLAVGTLFRILELLIIFYWLDSKYSLREVFYSLEKALNLFLYNLPIILIFFGIWLGANWGMSFFIAKEGASLYLNILFKYVMFFFDYLVISLLFTFYSLKKNKSYAESVFSPK